MNNHKERFSKAQREALKILEEEDVCLANYVEELFIKYKIGEERFKELIIRKFDALKGDEK